MSRIEFFLILLLNLVSFVLNLNAVAHPEYTWAGWWNGVILVLNAGVFLGILVAYARQEA